MIIKNISIFNFRQFKNEQKIVFSTDSKKNITLILGDNTSGKTTLLQAFMWGFYDVVNFDTKSILNAEVSEQMMKTGENSEVSISIEFEHQDVTYLLNRILCYQLDTDKNTIISNNKSRATMNYIQSDGQTKKIPDNKVKEKIEEILPQKLAIYFLYDTERFGNVSSREDVTNSVKRLLGLSVLEKMIEHLGTSTRSGTVLQQFNSKLNLENDENAQSALAEIKSAEDKLIDIQEQLILKQDELQNYEKIIVEKESILRTLEKTKTLQETKDRTSTNMENQKLKLNSFEENYYSDFKKHNFSFLGLPLFNRALKELTTAKLDTKSIRDMNARAIKDIIDRGVCVCGTEICVGNTAHQKLLEEIRFLPPESIGTLLKIFSAELKMKINNGEGYFSSLEERYKDILSTKRGIGDLEDEIAELNKELLEHSQDNIHQHQQTLIHAENKKKSLVDEIAELNKDLGKMTTKIANAETEYKKALSLSSKNKELRLYIEYTKAVLEWVKSRKVERETSIREQLENKVNFYFNKMYHGKRKVSINEKFQVQLLTTDLESPTRTDESQGLETVKNFAFISGLVDLAKQKLANADEKEAENYPLILDAPFSNADEKHVKNISEILPNVANQLILIVMAKDWNYAQDSLASKIGYEYYLNKQSEIYTSIEGIESNVSI